MAPSPNLSQIKIKSNISQTDLPKPKLLIVPVDKEKVKSSITPRENDKKEEEDDIEFLIYEYKN